MRHQPRRGIDCQGVDFLGRLVRDLLDLDSALGRSDDRDPARLAIDEKREVEFLGDVDSVGDVESLDLLSGRSGLHRHQRLAEHLRGILADLVDRVGEANSALGRLGKFLELALAAASRVDLRLDDPERPGKLLRGLDCLVDAHRGKARGHRHSELRKKLFRLIFVDVHGLRP